MLQREGVILVANHTFETDPFFLLAALQHRPDIFMIVEAGFLGMGVNIDRHLIPVHITHHQEIIDLAGWRSLLLNIIRRPVVLEKEEALAKNIESIKLAAEKLKSGGLVIIFPSASVKSGKWFSGVGHLLKHLGNQSRAKIILVHISGPSRKDYLRLIPGISQRLAEIKVRFSDVLPLQNHWHEEPKTMAYALEEHYNRWINKST